MNPPAPKVAAGWLVAKVAAGWLVARTASPHDGVPREVAIQVRHIECISPLIGPDTEGKCAVIMTNGGRYTVMNPPEVVLAHLLGVA